VIVAAIAAPQGIRWFENQKLAQAAHEEQTEPETSIPEKPTAGEPRAELVAKDREPAAAHPPSTPAAPPKPATAARAPSRAPATAPAQRESKSWAAQIAYAVTSSPATESAAPAPAPVPRPVAAEGTRSAAPAAPAGRFFEQRDVDESPAIATRIDPKLPGDVPARLRNDIVIVRLLVSQSGHPFRVSLLRKSKAGPSVDDAVVAAVTRWTFSPARKRGEAVSCWLNVAVPLGQAG
jgi:TonB family protein